MVSRARRAGAARTPAWRIPPPSCWRTRRARTMRSAEPRSSAPTGQHRPFERSTIRVSAHAARSRGATPSATAAFQSRAPSMCTRSPASREAAITSSVSSTVRTAPPPRLCVFSRRTRPISGRFAMRGFTARRTCSARSRPSSVGTVCGATPDSTAMPASSCWTTWVRASVSTSWPGSVRRRIAISLPMVPEGTKSAASKPRSRAAVSCRRLTVGSSP